MDDYPYGGGCGMVMYAQPICDCCGTCCARRRSRTARGPGSFFLTAAGKPYTEQEAKRLAQYDGLLLVCGHYEGWTSG